MIISNNTLKLINMAPEHTFLLEKARKYCAYQERSIFEVKTKLISWNIKDKIISEIILSLKKVQLYQ